MKPTATRAHILSALLLTACMATSNTALRAQVYVISTYAGTGSAGSGGDGAAATAAQLNQPHATAVDASGNVFIADATNNRIRKITASTGFITTIAGTGTAGYNGDNIAANTAQINRPYGITLDGAGNVYITDQGDSRVRKITTSTGIITTIAGTGAAGFSGDGGLATSAALNTPFGVSVDGAGNVFIADATNNRIRKITASTGFINTIAGTGTAGYNGDNIAANTATLNFPSDVVVDGSGNVYIADRTNNRVRKITTSTGIITTLAGLGTAAFSGDGGAATSAAVNSPANIALDASGNVYITQPGDNRLRKITTSTGIITTLAGTGTAGSTGDGGVATSAALNLPYGLSVDGLGRVYIATFGDHRIRKLGVLNNGLAFDGIDDYTDATVSALPQGNATRTLECWVNAPTGTTASIVNWGTSTTGLRFGVIASAGSMYIVGENNDYNTGVSICDGTWHHIAATFDGTTVRCYKDGTLIGSAAKTYNTSGTTLRTGQRVAPLGAEYLNGSVDEVRVWNRALCQAEIVADMNGELPAPTTQNGLVAYYTLDQGTAGGTNTGITTATDAVSGNNATLNNFALTGTASNWVAGATAITGTNAPYSSVAQLSNISESLTRTISGTTNFTSCNAIASVAPGTLSGSVTTKVWYDASVQTYNSAPYVQRHYDIEPVTNATTATATVTLYYTQAEFTAYNAAPNHGLNLPTSTSDNADAANLRITQYHGVPTGGNDPANYPATWGGAGNPHISITPSSITYNSTASRWEVVIPVTGFSGFFATSIPVNPLPVKLLAFTAFKANSSSNKIDWATGVEDAGTTFDVTRSSNGSSFDALGSVAGKGSNSTYSYPDAQPLAGINYYRLKITEASGETTYSNIAIVRSSSTAGAITITPQPANNTLTITNSDAALSGQEAAVYSMEGKIMTRFAMSSVRTLDISSWAPGIYTLRLPSGDAVRVVKQ